MSVDSKMTAIADAIRAKTGGTDLLTLDGMAEAIAAIEAGGGGDDLAAQIVERTVTEFSSSAVETVGSYAFYSCIALTSVDLPACTSVGSYAFQNCSALTSVDLPACTSVGSSVFRYCSALASVVLRNESQVCTLGNKNAFNDTPIASGTGYVYVPDALVDSYKAATNWSTYADQIKPLSEYVEVSA